MNQRSRFSSLLGPFVLVCSICLSLAVAGCGDGGGKGKSDKLTPITLQTDWYAQAEHGGFYQALAKGYYEEEGLDVTIQQGGPNAMVTQKVATGKAQFAIGRSDDVLIHSARSVPLIMTAAFMQHDPQAILFHEESGIQSFEDLDGKAIMATPGSSFLEIIQRTYDIDFRVIPLDYGLSRFLADKDFIQQSFITNEPYYVRKEGANPGTLLIANSGFDPYRVIYTRKNYVEKNPEIAAAFTRASIRGWIDYMENDPSPGNEIIAARNTKMTEEFMAFSHDAMDEFHLVTGRPGTGEAPGQIDLDRIARNIEQLEEIGMLDEPIAAGEVVMKEKLDGILAEL